MTIKQKTRPYETLIRHHSDGTIGAHHQTITEIINGEEVIAATVNAPVDINPDLDLVLGQATTSALSELAAVKIARDAAQSERDNVISEYSELEQQTSARIQSANLKIEQMQEEINRLAGLLSTQNEVSATEDK